jgi:signal transduction histidine kinase
VTGQPKIETVSAASLYSDLRNVPAFRELQETNLECLGALQLVEAQAGMELASTGSPLRCFWVLLQGQVRVFDHGDEARTGAPLPLATFNAGETFGEMPILAGSSKRNISVVATAASRLLRFDEESFWRLMFTCPGVRSVVIGNMARHLQALQADAVHREKLVMLGTVAAGLMHELNNPGAAARRASSQLRENLRQLQEIGLRLTRNPMTPEQIACLVRLQEQALSPHCCTALGSLEQADAEEKLAEYLEQVGVQDAWRLAPVLVDNCIGQSQLACMQGVFTGERLSDMLHWLEALVSSAQLVGTVEESIARITDLVKAVKQYSWEGNGAALDLHLGLKSTLLILAHKIRAKELRIAKEFASDLPPLEPSARGLNQVWTNLLDNAIDASPEGGVIQIRTQFAGESILVSIRDEGPGIPETDRARIFEPYFTTKKPGEGTGLGLGIVRRIVVEQLGGRIEVHSHPGSTEFTIALPARRQSQPS